MRAALEDHFCGKLLGLPMGFDIYYTNDGLGRFRLCSPGGRHFGDPPAAGDLDAIWREFLRFLQLT